MRRRSGGSKLRHRSSSRRPNFARAFLDMNSQMGDKLDPNKPLHIRGPKAPYNSNEASRTRNWRALPRTWQSWKSQQPYLHWYKSHRLSSQDPTNLLQQVVQDSSVLVPDSSLRTLIRAAWTIPLSSSSVTKRKRQLPTSTVAVQSPWFEEIRQHTIYSLPFWYPWQ